MPPTRNNEINVLITGFGPFLDTKVNPSYAASKSLHGTTISVPGLQRNIRLTVLEIEVAYSTISSLVPGFHARPPVLPSSSDTPENGFDFILHIGQGDTGYIALETLAHKSGYEMADAHGKFAPVFDNAGGTAGGGKKKKNLKVVRGVSGNSYTELEDELNTDVDVERLVRFLNKTDKNVQLSTDPGRYVCDFIMYSSLAEARVQAAARVGEDVKPPAKVLFMHVPPAGQPHSLQQMTEAIKKVVSWVVENHVVDE